MDATNLYVLSMSQPLPFVEIEMRHGDPDLCMKKLEEIRCSCIRFIDNYRFLSNSLDSSVNILVDNSHKTLENLKEEIVDNDEILSIVNEIKILIEEEEKYKNDSFKKI